MKFEIDAQTIKDLDLLPVERNAKSVLGFFNMVKTIGGYNVLLKMIQSPTGNLVFLNSRRTTIQFFSEQKLQLPLNRQQLDLIERYLNLNIIPLRDNVIDAVLWSLKNKFKQTSDYYILRAGIENLVGLSERLFQFLSGFGNENCPEYLKQIAKQIREILSKGKLLQIISRGERKITFRELAYLDNFFRKREKENIRILIDLVYQIDVFQSVAKAFSTHQLAFPEYIIQESPTVDIEGFYHPFIDEAVRNDITIERDKNLLFLTGPNMAGKSTLMKSVGICLFLAHIGFPVPARRMRTTIFKGIITTINLSDNVNLGYSHFYSEVRRVKEAVLKILENEKVIIMFDELFRGTNVKDAYDGTLAIISALSKIPKSIYVISTHIVEVAEKLEFNKNILFKCLNSNLEGDELTYSFKLTEGISSERVGMQIIRNEKILQILENAAEKQKKQLPK